MKRCREPDSCRQRGGEKSRCAVDGSLRPQMATRAPFRPCRHDGCRRRPKPFDNMSGMKERTSADFRWWPAALVMALLALGLIAIWSREASSQQVQVLQTYMAVILSAFLLAIWWLFLSGLSWLVRIGGVLALILMGFSASRFVRHTGFSGNLVPILEWSWTDPADSAGSDQSTSLGVADANPAEFQPGPHDYPQFLGPDRDARLEDPGLARDWEATPPRELWRRPVGQGWSSFAVSGQAVLTQEQVGPNEIVASYRLSTGEPLWRTVNDTSYEHPLAGAGPRATPTISSGRVFTLGAGGKLSCLELSSGRMIWQRDIHVDNDVKNVEYGRSSSPLLVDGLAVINVGGKEGPSLVAYDSGTGEMVWRAGSDSSSYSSPMLAQLAGQRQIVIFNNTSVAGHGIEDGRLLWRQDWPHATPNATQPVILPDDRLLISAGYGAGAMLFEIIADAQGEFRPKQVWTSNRLKSKFATAVYHAPSATVFGLDEGILTALNPADGQRRWKRGRYGHGQIILVGDLLIVSSEKGFVAMVEATPDEFRELGRFAALDSKTWNNPALSGNVLLVRNHREAAAYELPMR